MKEKVEIRPIAGHEGRYDMTSNREVIRRAFSSPDSRGHYRDYQRMTIPPSRQGKVTLMLPMEEGSDKPRQRQYSVDKLFKETFPEHAFRNKKPVLKLRRAIAAKREEIVEKVEEERKAKEIEPRHPSRKKRKVMRQRAIGAAVARYADAVRAHYDAKKAALAAGATVEDLRDAIASPPTA